MPESESSEPTLKQGIVSTPSGPPTIPTEKDKLEEFYRSYAMYAFSVVLNEFPLKIKQIEAMKNEFDWHLIATIKPGTEWIRQFTQTYVKSSDKAQQAKDRCISSSVKKPFLFDMYEQNGNSMIATNQTVHGMISRIKPYIMELADLTLQLSFAIELLEPKFQEGNNFGLEVQAKALRAVNDAYSTTQEYLESLKNFYYNRERVLSTAMSNPHVEDYEMWLTEQDRSFMYTLCRSAEDLYSAYTAIHDLATKNIDKLLRPRDDDGDAKKKPADSE